MSLFPIIAPVASVPATVTYVATAGNDTDTTSYTFSSLGTGTADANRQTAVIVFNGNSSSAFSDVTLGGASMTKIVEVVSAKFTASIWIKSNALGTTATFVVTTSGTAGGCAINTYALVGAAASASDTLTSTAIPPTGTIDCPAGGVIIGGATRNQSASWTWEGITEDQDASYAGGEDNARSSASAAFATVQTGLTITATPSTGTLTPAMAVASFGPA